MSVEKFKTAVDSGDILGAILSLDTFLSPNTIHFSLGWTNALVYAIRNDMGCLVPIMLEREFYPNTQCKQGKSALHFAIECIPRDMGIVKALLGAGANVNLSDDDDWTPLHYASRWGDAEVAKLLLDRGADVSLPDSEGDLPIHIATRYGNEEMLRVLLNAGSNPNIKDGSAKTPLLIAVIWGHVGIIKLLLKAGVEVDARDSRGRAALHYLDQHGDHPQTQEIALALLKAGASVYTKDNTNHTPIESVRRARCIRLARLLEESTITVGVQECEI